jgi:hypothetical protein
VFCLSRPKALWKFHELSSAKPCPSTSPIVGWEAPDVTQDTPNDLQDTPNVPQETPDNLQEAHHIPQETPDDLQETPDNQQENVNDIIDIKITKLSWRDLPFDAEVNNQLLEHFCRRSSDKDSSKPSRSALLQLLLKYMVTSGNLIVDAINEEGVPILRRGDTTHVAGDVMADVTLAPAREMHSIFESQSQPPHMTFEPQSQPCHGQTPTQLAQAGVKVAKMALNKATRTAQERLQGEAQEVKRRKQEVTADSKKLKKEARYKASVDNLGRLPGCPRLCRGEECTGTPMWGGGARLPLRQHRRHGCLHGQGTHVHGHQGRVPDVPSLAKEVAACTSGRSTKKLERGPRARGKPPRNATQERGTGPSSSGSSSLEGSSSSSVTWTTGDS